MRAADYSPIRVTDYHGQPVRFVQPKLDGVRAVLRVGPGGVTMRSRSGRTDYWPQMAAQLSGLAHSLPIDSVLDGELYREGAQSDEAITAVFAGTAVFSVFGVPYWGGARIDALEEGLGLARAAGLSTATTSPCEAHPDPDEWCDRAQHEGLEGFVFKHDAFSGWYRVKPVQTLDVLVTGVTLSTSASYAGGLRSLQVADASGRDLGSVGTGFSREFRLADPSGLVGRVAEVAFDSLTRAGKLRFARFLRWRPDKQIQPSGLFSTP